MPLNPMISRRYAGALFQLANDKSVTTYFGKSQALLTELTQFIAALKATNEGTAFFLNPVISRADKISAIADLESKFPLIHSFIVVLIEANRMEYLEEIGEEFKRECEEAAGELTVAVEFAHEPSPSILDEVRSTLQSEWKRKINVQASVNQKILGGFIAKAPGRVMDVSVASQLDSLEQQLIA